MRPIAIALFALAAILACRPTSAQECGKAGPKKDCVLALDRRAPVSGKSVAVENETRVTVVLVNKSPFESCKNEVKREEIPDVSSIPTLLSLVSTLGSSFFGRNEPRAMADARAKNPTADDIANKLTDLARHAGGERDAAEKVQEAYDAESARLGTFYATRYGQDSTATFERNRAERQAAVEAVLKLQLPQSAGAEATYRAILAEYSDYVQAKRADPAMIGAVAERIDVARSMLDALADALKVLETARTRFQSTLKYLEQLARPEWEARLPVRMDRNAKVTGNVTCTSDVTGRPTLDPPLVYTIVFRSTPPLSLTAGVLLSSLPRNSVGIEAVEDGRTGGTVTTHPEIRDHPTRPQAIPFSFVNIRLGSPIEWHRRIVTINLAPGLGVNPNNNGTRAEFFLGGSVGVDSLFVSFGGHIGHALQPANGFQLGDRPPADVKAVPVEVPWTVGLGLSVSYRIPLK